jgi:hypothetical protein
MIWSRRILLATALPLSACAGAQHRPENTSARVRDSAPEKAAAQRAATPGLALEADDERWGITAAAQRKRAQDDQKAKAAAATGGPGTSRVDLAPSTPKR